MRVRIWGARGSIPSPLRPEEVREKLISAILGISQIEDEGLKQDLIQAILEDAAVTGRRPVEPDTPEKRHQIVASYLETLSPLLSGSAGGNTPCVEVRTDRELFIIDAGSGIRNLGLELMAGPCGQGQGVIHLLFSHPHWDHIQGFPFFRPAFIPGNRIFIYSVHDLEGVLKRQQEPVNFPVSLAYMQAELIFIRLKPDETLEFGDLRIRCLRNEHPGDAYSFRFEKGDRVLVYASDAAYPAGLDLRPHLNFFADADILIYDAQFTQRESDEKEDWGHSSSFVGVEMAQQAQVKNLVLFHFDPAYSDANLAQILEDTLKFQQTQYPNQKPVNVLIAHEGQTFELTSTHLVQLQRVPGSKIATLKPSGIFNERVVLELKEQLQKLKKFDGPSHVVVDMSAIERLQVTGLSALVKLSKEQPTTSIALAGPTTTVQQLIELAGYADYFVIYPSLHSAISTLQAHETLNLPGQMIKNRYYIEAKMGDGQLGTVFKATDTRLNRPVAIKVLSRAFSEGAIEQFLQHGRQIIDLIHPNIVGVFDCDRDQGLPFMVEELIEGQTLGELIDQQAGQPLPYNLALRIAENIAQGLEYAHSQGVIHGDLKPKNILLADRVKISDFGLGRLESGKSPLTIDVPLDLITAHYLAPEQILGHPIDARTDLYALGIILYEMLTGQRPFGGSDQELMEQHRRRQPLPPRQLNPALPDTVEHLILKLLDKDPNKRYATARQTRRILAGMRVVVSSDVQPPAFAPYRGQPPVGRAEIWQQLQALWTKTEQGQGQLVMIAGEAGLGKTHLVRELAQHLNRATLLLGNCRQPDGRRAGQPFIDAVNDYLANTADNQNDSGKLKISPVGKLLDRVAPYAPEIAQFFTLLTEADRNLFSMEGHPDPTRRFSLAETLAEVTAEQPWLLILDDLHYADHSSLRLLQYLAGHCAGLNLMIVGLYRESEVAQHQLLAEILESFNQYRHYTRLNLKPLAEAEVAELLGQIWSQTVPADLVATIYRRSQGNPLYTAEIARLLTDENVVTWRGGQRHFEPVVEASLPVQLPEVILRRVHRLPRKTQLVLNQAAVLGPTFATSDLQEMDQHVEPDFYESLDILLERQLIHQGSRLNWLEFSHRQLQRTLYEDLTALKRRSLHRAAGEALERRYPSNLEAVSEELAHHFLQAGEPDKGLTYSLQAARLAESIHAQQNALLRYTQALDALEQLGLNETTQPQKFELLLRREQIYQHLGVRSAQAADLMALLALAQTLAEPTQQAVVLQRQASFEQANNRFNQADTAAQTALAAARQAGEARLEAAALLILAEIAAAQGHFGLAQERLQAAHHNLGQLNGSSEQARALNQQGAIHKNLNNYAEAAQAGQQANALSQAAGNRYIQADSLLLLGGLHFDQGDYGQALRYCQQALTLNRLIGSRLGEARSLNHLAMIYRALGEPALAQSYLQAALTIRRQLDDGRGKAEDLVVLSGIDLSRGEYWTARDYAGEALEIFQRFGLRPLESQSWLELGLAQELLGDLTKAEAAYSQGHKLQQELGNQAGALDAQAGLARCLLAAGQIDQARQRIEACLAALQDRGAAGLKHPIRLYLTAYWVLQAGGNKEKAVVALQAGCELLKKRAKTIEDVQLRTSFMEQVPENKELSTQLEAVSNKSKGCD